MEGQKFGAGAHTITLTAVDWAGNESTSESIHVTVNEASYQPLGPGAVNLKTGDYKLTASDINIAGAGGSLTLSRAYDSRELSQGAAGPLGPQWALSLPDAPADGEWQSLQVLPNGSVQTTAASGNKVTFVPSGSGYTSPASYQTITLSKLSSSEYRLTDGNGDATIFTKASSTEEEAPIFVPSGVVQATGAGGLNSMTYLFTKTTAGIIEPTGVLAPYPSSLKCSEKLTKKEELVTGCRALEFFYAEATKEKIGENETEWGEYKGRLKAVKFVAYEPISKKMAAPITVAEYVYDKLGRLRAEWNPQLSTPLKTIYGYDSEGHVTVVTSPGQQPWVFTYGTTAADSSTGRLLKIMRPAVSTSAWSGVLPVNTTEPKLTGSAVVGNKLSVSEGKWSGAPLTYGYQWERCTGGSCVAIPGANNQSYTPVTSDIGHTLVAHVTATNAGGSVTAASAVSGGVGSTAEITEYAVPANSQPYELALGPDKNVWFADLATAKIGKTTTSGSTTEYSLAASSEPTGIVAGSDGNIWFTEFGANKIGKITTSGTVSTYTIPTSGSEPLGIAAGPGGEAALWFTECAANKIGKITTSGTITEYTVPGGGNPREITAGPDGNLWFTQTSGSKIGKITTSGTVTEYSLPAESVPYNITAGPDGNLWFTDEGTSKIGKITTAGTITEYSLPTGSTPIGINSGPGSDLWFTEDGGNKIGKITTSGAVTEYPVPTSASGAWDITTGADGNLWFTERSSSKIGTLDPTKVEGEHTSPAPGWTVDYNIPLSGTGLPTMTKAEVEKWGQKEDLPVEGTAIFPPDKLQSWPASEYTRATIYYLDGSERTVNVSSPTGGISTTEYDNHNNVKRALTADNRALALKEAKPSEAAEKLDTKSTYNAEGTELERTLGPEHEIKLQGATEAIKARKQVKYTYNEEGAPSGGPYRLVTKTVEAAKLANGEEKEPRTITDSYSGQEGLGWKLHQPTSTTTAPGGLNLVHSTVYSPTTGAEIETQMPTAAGQIAEYALPSNSDPQGIAKGPDGNLWFSDYGSSKVGKITTSGAITEYSLPSGSEPRGPVTGPDGNVWFIDYATSKIGKITTSGTITEYALPAGSEPSGITAGPDGNLWFVNDGTSKVGKITTSGTITEYALPAGSNPHEITTGPDGNLWFTDATSGKIGKITTSGAITEYALPSGSSPHEITSGPDGNLWFADNGTNKIGKITTSGTITEYALPPGSGPNGIAAGTDGNLWFTDSESNKIGRITTSGTVTEYALPAGSGPHEMTSGPDGNLWYANYSTSKIGKIKPSSGTGIEGAHDSQVIYYTPSTEASVVICQNHPQWANLPCETQPVHQPEVSGMPEVPVTTYTYNIWDQPETTKSTSGASTRTETDSYDAAARPLTKEISSSTGTALPKVSYKYNTTNGTLEKESTGTGSEEKTITSEYNTLGQLGTYTDAEGSTTTYEYEKEGDARLTKVTDAKGSQTYAYNATTGTIKELTDSTAGKFAATYDIEGNLVSEELPNGMSATTTANSVRETIGLVYKKTTHCTEKCEWYTDSVIPSIHGQWLSQTSSLSTYNYNYDETGRLTQVQDTPVGKECATRIYAYDADGNRTSFTKRAPTGGKCATEGGETETHTYDTADRLIDTGTAYDPFGDILTLPAADAGGSKLTSAYYADGQLASQEQGGQTIGYQLDPAKRTRETVATGKATKNTVDHYDGPGTMPSWMSYPPSSEWTRDISGIAGSLAAVQYNTETPVIQISNLHGDIVGEVPDSETATGLKGSPQDTTEYGVPTTSEPLKYAWLGAGEFPTELPSGVMQMGARSYVPQLGRFLQPDPQPGGSADAYAYTHGDPLNESDPSGEWSLNETSGGLSSVGIGEGEQLAGGVGIAAGAVMPLPVNAAIMAAFEADPPWDQVTAGNEEYEEYEEYEEEEGEEYEYASYRPEAESGKEERHVESGVLYQPLDGEATSEGATHSGSATPLCESVASGPCAYSVPNDKNKNVNSKCNETGQDCGRRRSRPSRNEGLKNACEIVGVGLDVASAADIPAAVARVILGGGVSANVACRQIG